MKEGAQASALVDEGLGEVRANEAGSAGEENVFHEGINGWRLIKIQFWLRSGF